MGSEDKWNSSLRTHPKESRDRDSDNHSDTGSRTWPVRRGRRDEGSVEEAPQGMGARESYMVSMEAYDGHVPSQPPNAARRGAMGPSGYHKITKPRRHMAGLQFTTERSRDGSGASTSDG